MNMKEISFVQAQKLTAPAPFALLSAVRDDGSTNLMAISWWNYVSNRPPMLSVCLSKKGLSGSLIEKNGEFGLCVVGDVLKEAALKCGHCSGRDHDKAEEFSVPLFPAARIAPQLVDCSRVAYECHLAGMIDAGDHILYTAEIIAAYGNPDLPQLFAFDGYSRLDTFFIDQG